MVYILRIVDILTYLMSYMDIFTKGDNATIVGSMLIETIVSKSLNGRLFYSV